MEEAGWRCKVIKFLEKVEYWFRRDGKLVKKSVKWFLMEPLEKTGESDADEIIEVRWTGRGEAEKLVEYKSDKNILKKISEYNKH